MCRFSGVLYCGVCELVVREQHHVYSCGKCDFLGHIECILRKGAAPSPLYLKDLYSCGGGITRPTDQDDCKTIKLDQNKLMVNGVSHTHVLRFVDLSELDERADCNICDGKIYGVSTNCDICREEISGFNLFCRICSFILHVKCLLKDNQFLGTLHRGQKLMVRTRETSCLKNHSSFGVTVSSSYPVTCTICEERLCGKIVSCVDCREVCHPWCIKALEVKGKLRSHPLHPDHKLRFFAVSGSKCIVCKLNITEYGYGCRKCEVSFHSKCVKAVGLSETTKYHFHCLYNFWDEDSTRACSVCARRCGASFYGCVDCGFSAHVECVGFPNMVKNQRHQHTVELTYSSEGKSCSLCGSQCNAKIYSCGHCKEAFHIQCIMSSTDGLEAATKEDQLRDIHLMYIEQDLLEIYPRW